MKPKLHFLMFMLFACSYANANECSNTLNVLPSTYFITTWETTLGNENITIPTTGAGYNYDVDWNNDGIFDDLSITANATHTYPVAGTHTVVIRGDFPRIYFNNAGDRQKILSVEQWGTYAWSSMESAFHGCSNLVVNATDIPNLSSVTDLSFMFTFCSSFNQDIGNWDVSTVINMAHTFRNTAVFNQDISSWDVSSVTSMDSMFWNSNVFNQDIGNWDVSNVTNMIRMFRSADTFNQDIGGWDVKNVTDMSLMFAGALSFDQNLGNWDISSITDMTSMFFANALSVLNYDATLIGWSTLSGSEVQIPENITFNGANSKYCIGENARNLLMSTPFSWNIIDGNQACTSAFITTWKTDNSGVTNNNSIQIPVQGADPYNYNVDWGDGTTSFNLTASSTHTYATVGTYTVTITGDFPRIYFNNAGDRQKILSVEQWGTYAWSSMESAFHGCSNLVVNATDIPNLSSVTDLSFMFTFCSSFNQDIGNWDVSTVINMAHTFRNTAVFNQDISSWDVSSVTSMDSMFWNSNVFNQDIGNWDVSNVTNMIRMFRSADTFNQDIGGWDVKNVTDMSLMFAGALSFDQNLGNWDISSITDMTSMFFANALSVLNYDATLIGWSTLSGSEVQIPENITFNGANSKYCIGENARNLLMSTPFSWNIIDGNQACTSAFITTWKTDNSGITNNNSIQIPVQGADPYKYNVDWGDGTFSTDLTAATTHNYSAIGTYTIKITGDYPWFWAGDSGDKNKLLSVDQWGNQEWKTMHGSFNGCSNVVINATDTPDLSQATSFIRIFRNASSMNQDLNGWDVSTITNMQDAFLNATSFNGDISAWDVGSVTTLANMFRNAPNFNQNLGNWNVSNVTHMNRMFENASSFNQDLSAWDVSNVSVMFQMFLNATSFDQNLGQWDISNVTNLIGMFDGVTLSIDNYDNTLIGWNTLEPSETQIPENITFSGGNSDYCNGEAARISLTSTPYDWTISDGDLDCSTLNTNENVFSGLNIYPNPTRNKININLQHDAIFAVIDISGRVVLKGELKTNKNVLDISNLSNGIYILKLIVGNHITIKKIIKE